ncbi:MAG: deoxyribose-phosphate aldolase [Actinomycetes bacterium]
MSSMPLTRSELAAMIDHTLLKPEATADDVVSLCRQARQLQVHAVCVSPTMVALAARQLDGSDVKVASVVAFPSGAHHSQVKAGEAAGAGDDGADEIDMVINLGLAGAGDWDGVRDDIAAVRHAVADSLTLKVILETALLDADQIRDACRCAEDAGAQFVKTSTGFHPAGGATLDAVTTLSEAVGGRLGVKASGGIRTRQAALALIEAGATRLGLSATATVLADIDARPGSAG